MTALSNPNDAGPSDWVTSLWRAHASRVLAYASRHVDPHTAQDIVADTFLVAWRRRDEIPDDPLPWLLVVARNHISNRVRSMIRARSAHEELQRLDRASAHTAVDVTATERAAVLAGLRDLSADDREVLLLAGWDGLDSHQAAEVLGIREATYRARLSRARRRFERAVERHDNSDLDQGPNGRRTR